MIVMTPWFSKSSIFKICSVQFTRKQKCGFLKFLLFEERFVAAVSVEGRSIAVFSKFSSKVWMLAK